MEYSTSTCNVVGSSTVCTIETLTNYVTTSTTTEVVFPQYVETGFAVQVMGVFFLTFVVTVVAVKLIISNFTK